MTILPSSSRPRSRIWAGCLLLAVVAGAVAAGPAAVAAPTAAGARTQLAAGAVGTPSGPGHLVGGGARHEHGSQPRPDRVQLRRRQGRLPNSGSRGDRRDRSAQSAAFSVDYNAMRAGPALRVRSSCRGFQPEIRPTSAPGPVSRAAPSSCRRLSPVRRPSSVAFYAQGAPGCPPRRATTPARGAAFTVSARRPRARTLENNRVAVPLEVRVPGPLEAGSRSSPSPPASTTRSTRSGPAPRRFSTPSPIPGTSGSAGPRGQNYRPLRQLRPPSRPAADGPARPSVRVTANVSGLFPDGPMTAHVDVESGWPKGTIPAANAALAANANALLFAFPWSLIGLILLLVAIGVGILFDLRWRRRLRRAELASVAARARRDTEQRLLGGRAAANGHSANGDKCQAVGGSHGRQGRGHVPGTVRGGGPRARHRTAVGRRPRAQPRNGAYNSKPPAHPSRPPGGSMTAVSVRTPPAQPTPAPPAARPEGGAAGGGTGLPPPPPGNRRRSPVTPGQLVTRTFGASLLILAVTALGFVAWVGLSPPYITTRRSSTPMTRCGPSWPWNGTERGPPNNSAQLVPMGTPVAASTSGDTAAHRDLAGHHRSGA